MKKDILKKGGDATLRDARRSDLEAYKRWMREGGWTLPQYSSNKVNSGQIG